MIVSSFQAYQHMGRTTNRGMSGFGAVSPVTNAPCPAGTSESLWCDCMWPVAKDPAMNAKCKSQPWGFLTAKPWTAVGAGQRGIPFTGDVSLPGAGGAVDAGSGAGGTYVGGSSDTLFGVPKKVLYIGGGLLGVGILAMALGGKKKGGAVAGYRRSRKSRKGGR